jgi:hypothetical protein
MKAKRWVARSLRRIAHQLDPDYIKSVRVRTHCPTTYCRPGDPPPKSSIPDYVDIQFRTGSRVAGYVYAHRQEPNAYPQEPQ